MKVSAVMKFVGLLELLMLIIITTLLSGSRLDFVALF